MNLPKVIKDVIGYVSGALTRIFGLNDDSYPETGVQPYEGELSDKKQSSDW
ncbi:hypothetical protein [Phormidesmis priestleyi]|uniref:hypothetical protein n=1 Tax=Phormidesmis priestleyi TaxID=268141 RepID=UPI000A9EB30B|nr:hypothetical protein [Phormidesmis priestleyi]